MTIAIVSLGQLISSNVQTFKHSFESALANEGNNVKGDDVWTWLRDYLPRLRLNQITLEALCGEFNTYFTSSMPFEDFKQHFNSMCLINEASLQQINEINDFLSDHPDIQFLIVSHTNVSHFNYIMEQLEPVIPTCSAGILNSENQNPSGQMIFATSMASQCEQHPDTLQWALNTLNLHVNQPIISFLNTIQHINEATNFTYIPTTTLTTEHIIQSVSALQEQNTQCYRF